VGGGGRWSGAHDLALARFGPRANDAEWAETGFIPEVILIPHAKNDFGVSYLAAIV